MSALVTEQHIESYTKDGVLLVRNLFDSKWIHLVAEGIEENLRNPTQRTREYVNEPETGMHFFFDACVKGEIEAYDCLMMSSPMAEAAAKIMRSSTAILFYISVFVRTPGTHRRTPWHQDQLSWAAAGDQALSAWMPLDPVPKETALEFVRGSHRWTSVYQRPPFFQTEYEGEKLGEFAPFPDIENHRDDYEIVSWEMEPGDCLFFHGMTIHGGSGNLPAGLGRRAVSVQWLGDDARFRVHEDDPQISKELLKYDLKSGEKLVCDLCPIVFPPINT